MGFTDFFRKKAPDRPVSDEPLSPVFLISGQPVRLLSQAAAMTAEVAQRKIPQLYRITNFVSSAIQSVEWYCEPDEELPSTERAGPAQIKAINNLLKSPNDTMTAQQFLYWTTLNMMLYSRAHFKVGIGTAGLANGLYPLAAKHMKGILNNRGTVEKYEYGMPPNIEIMPTRRSAVRGQAYAAEISIPSISGLVEYNKAPAAIESITMPLQIIDFLMQRARDTASGHPNIKYVITTEKTLTKQQTEALAKHLEEAGPDQDESGSVLFLYNTTVQIHPLDNKLSDIHSKIPLDDMTRQVAGVFGVPVPLLGLGSADAAKFAGNYEEARLSFWQDTVIPSYLVPIAGGMTQAICPPGAKICFDLDDIPALWYGRAQLGEKLGKIPFLTDNEKRVMLDYDVKTGGDELPSRAPPKVRTVEGDEPPADVTNNSNIVPMLKQ
jgi:phage portal protein BeeE